MIKQIIISAIVSVAILIGFVSFYPLFQNDNLGIANLTDITSGSTVSDFPAVYTANNTALEGAINTIEGTTTISTLTTASGLVTVGPLSSGSLAAGFTDVPVAQGGTGASTFTQYQLLFGSSTNPLISLGSIGTNGQFLTSSGAGALPTWTTSAVDQSGAFNWTGLHDFAATTTMATTTQASSTITDLNVLNDLFIIGGLGTTTAGVFETSGNIYVGGGRIQNLGYEFTTTTLTTSATQAVNVQKDLDCDTAGYKVISGGFANLSQNDNANQEQLDMSYPLDEDTWRFNVICASAGCSSGTVTLYAICIDI